MACATRGFRLALVVVAGWLAARAGAQQLAAPGDRDRGSDRPSAQAAQASAPARLTRSEGLFMLDYQVIPVPQGPSLDLLGIHVMSKVSDWLHLGAGLQAPLVRGSYGGFMAFDIGAHAQRRVWRELFVDAGLALGGGGGGKSKEQSRLLSGTGGFAKGYLGLGWDFGDLAVGINLARMKFRGAAIDHRQLDFFVQVPFTTLTGAYASVGDRLDAAQARELDRDHSESTLSASLDNYVQIRPRGSVKSTIRLAELQYAHYLDERRYWYASLGIGYQGLRLYNQMIGGLGWRFRVARGLDLHAQLGLGSGGWAPDRIDTGSGLLVYPQVGAEYALGPDLGLVLGAGYLWAPTGSSKNVSYSAALSYHLRSGRPADASAADYVFRGYRISLFQQTAFHVHDQGSGRENIRMLSGQFDVLAGDHVYIPLQAAVAYSAYLGYPAYGEILAGVGIQSQVGPGQRWQFYAQLLGGAQDHGPIWKPGVGVNFGLSDRLAIYLAAGRTLAAASNRSGFSADYAALGLSYRYAVPSR